MGDDNSNECIDNTEFADGFGFGFDGLELPNDIDSGCIVLLMNNILVTFYILLQI